MTPPYTATDAEVERVGRELMRLLTDDERQRWQWGSLGFWAKRDYWEWSVSLSVTVPFPERTRFASGSPDRWSLRPKWVGHIEIGSPSADGLLEQARAVLDLLRSAA